MARLKHTRIVGACTSVQCARMAQRARGMHDALATVALLQCPSVRRHCCPLEGPATQPRCVRGQFTKPQLRTFSVLCFTGLGWSPAIGGAPDSFKRRFASLSVLRSICWSSKRFCLTSSMSNPGILAMLAAGTYKMQSSLCDTHARAPPHLTTRTC